MALNPSNSSNLEQLALKGLSHFNMVHRCDKLADKRQERTIIVSSTHRHRTPLLLHTRLKTYPFKKSFLRYSTNLSDYRFSGYISIADWYGYFITTSCIPLKTVGTASRTSLLQWLFANMPR